MQKTATSALTEVRGAQLQHQTRLGRNGAYSFDKPTFSFLWDAERERFDDTTELLLHAVEEHCKVRFDQFRSYMVGGLTYRPKLSTLWLYTLPGELRQQHNCTACKKLIDRYGTLRALPSGCAQIDNPYQSYFWGCYNDINEPYATSFRIMSDFVQSLPPANSYRPKTARRRLHHIDICSGYDHLVTLIPQ